MVQNVFLGGKEESTEGEGTGGESECFESWLFVCRDEERNLVANGFDEVSRYGWEGTQTKITGHSYPCHMIDDRIKLSKI